MNQINLGHISIRSLNKQKRQLVLHLKVESSACEINDPKVRRFIKSQIDAAVSYLTSEGFIDEEDRTDWHTALQLEHLQ